MSTHLKGEMSQMTFDSFQDSYYYYHSVYDENLYW